MSWLNYLNAIEGSPAAVAPSPSTGTTPPNGLSGLSPSSQAGFLSDELRAQLEAWTTVNFDDVSSAHNVDLSLFDVAGSAPSLAAGGGGTGGTAQHDSLAGPGPQAEHTKADPSPYSKRPFGHLQQPAAASQSAQQAFSFDASPSAYQLQTLQRSFNAFAGNHAAGLEGSSLASGSSDEQHSTSKLFDFGLPNLGAVDGSNTLFATPASPAVAATSTNGSRPSNNLAHLSGALEQQNSTASPANAADATSEPSSKKRRTSSTSLATTPSMYTDSASSVGDESASGTVENKASSSSSNKHLPLTKAAVLAQQAAELAAQKVNSEEEEAARQAELNRIAAEDDKRRRNTAASARFRVKKKQREAALEDNVRELAGKIERLEKELESTRNENAFLRDIVIKKIGASGGLAASAPAPVPAPAPAPVPVPTKVPEQVTASNVNALLELPIISQPLEMLDGRSNGSDSGKISGGLNGATGMGTWN